jgi:hypothetical protein
MTPALEGKQRRKVVVGGTHRDFLHWCRENGISPMRCIRPTFREHLMGLEIKKEDIVRLGYMSPEMETELLLRIR